MRELDECGISHSEKTLPGEFKHIYGLTLIITLFIIYKGLQEKVPNNEIMRKGTYSPCICLP